MENEKLAAGMRGLAAGIIALDQVTKYFFSTAQNFGLPFGLDLAGDFDLYLVAALLAIFVLFYGFFFRRISFGFVLIVSGAVSNLFDRIYFGYVRDFIDVGIATMNVADAAVWMGILLLLKSQIPSAKSQTISNDRNSNSEIGV